MRLHRVGNDDFYIGKLSAHRLDDRRQTDLDEIARDQKIGRDQNARGAAFYALLESVGKRRLGIVEKPDLDNRRIAARFHALSQREQSFARAAQNRAVRKKNDGVHESIRRDFAARARVSCCYQQADFRECGGGSDAAIGATILPARGRNSLKRCARHDATTLCDHDVLARLHGGEFGLSAVGPRHFEFVHPRGAAQSQRHRQFAL